MVPGARTSPATPRAIKVHVTEPDADPVGIGSVAVSVPCATLPEGASAVSLPIVRARLRKPASGDSARCAAAGLVAGGLRSGEAVVCAACVATMTGTLDERVARLDPDELAAAEAVGAGPELTPEQEFERAIADQQDWSMLPDGTLVEADQDPTRDGLAWLSTRPADRSQAVRRARKRFAGGEARPAVATRTEAADAPSQPSDSYPRTVGGTNSPTTPEASMPMPTDRLR